MNLVGVALVGDWYLHQQRRRGGHGASVEVFRLVNHFVDVVG
jgi:hypothetical protein